MELVQMLQLGFIFAIFLLTLLFVLLPLKLVPSDPQRLASRQTKRMLDLCNSFSCGVFLGSCFVQLVPHAEATMEQAFGDGGLPIMYCTLLTQLSCMLGFFAVLLVDRAVDVCRGSRHRPVRRPSVPALEDTHELSTVKQYIVTVSSSDGTGSDDDSEIELVQERDRMLRSKSASDRNAVRLPKKKKSHTEVKHSDVNGLVGAATANGASSHVHSHLVAPVENDDLNLRCLVLLLALSLHMLFEGVAVGLQDMTMQLIGLCIGITVHGCLVAFALGMALVSRHASQRTATVRFGIVYSLMVPIGVGIGMGIGTIHSFVGRLLSAILQSLTAGTFVYVIFVELLPNEMDKNRDRLLKVVVMFLGFLVIGILRFVTVFTH